MPGLQDVRRGIVAGRLPAAACTRPSDVIAKSTESGLKQCTTKEAEADELLSEDLNDGQVIPGITMVNPNLSMPRVRSTRMALGRSLRGERGSRCGVAPHGQGVGSKGASGIRRQRGRIGGGGYDIAGVYDYMATMAMSRHYLETQKQSPRRFRPPTLSRGPGPLRQIGLAGSYTEPFSRALRTCPAVARDAH